MTASPPLRLLACVIGGWVCLRVATMALDAFEGLDVMPRIVIAGAPRAVAHVERASSHAPRTEGYRAPSVTAAASRLASPPPRETTSAELSVARQRVFQSMMARPQHRSLPAAPPLSLPLVAPHPRHGWSVYAWLFLRDGAGSALASGGTLGRSQAGARAVFPLADRLAASVRVSSPIDGPGAEAAVGVEWTPFDGAPLRLLAERRERLDRGGRSAFALTLHGGVHPTRVGPVEVEAYGQAGVVGLRSRDLFVDGAAAGGVPIGHSVRIGAGVWGAAQPGAARLDIGPQVVARVPLGQVGLRVAAEWRLRVAGDAAPASGPALTLSAGF